MRNIHMSYALRGDRSKRPEEVIIGVTAFDAERASLVTCA